MHCRSAAGAWGELERNGATTPQNAQRITMEGNHSPATTRQRRKSRRADAAAKAFDDAASGEVPKNGRTPAVRSYGADEGLDRFDINESNGALRVQTAVPENLEFARKRRGAQEDCKVEAVTLRSAEGSCWQHA